MKGALVGGKKRAIVRCSIAYRNHRGIHVPANEKGQDSIHRALAVIPQAKRPEGEFPRAGAFRSVRSARHAGTNVTIFCSK